MTTAPAPAREPLPPPLGRKQSATHEDFWASFHRITEIVPRPVYEARLEAAAAEVHRVCKGKRAAFGWSGGKDALALQAVCRRAGVERCVLGMTDHLEYPDFLAWVTDNMPAGLTVVKNGWDIEWLAAHPEMLFPQTADVAAKWFKGVQHYAQAKYFRDEKLDLILLGRRRADGNYVGKGGLNVYEADGVTRYSPIADWSHEMVLASLEYEGWRVNLPPFYHWPRGFRCGTHAWPARQWCAGVPHGWSEVYAIDPGVVRAAALKIDTAAAFLKTLPGGRECD